MKNYCLLPFSFTGLGSLNNFEGVSLKTITAQDLYNFTKCHHRVYLDANGNPEERVEVGSFVKLLWELGLQTEREYIASIGEVMVEDLESLSLETASGETLRLMKAGVPLI